MSLRFSLTLLLVVAMSQLMQQVDGRKKLCGDALNEALDLICVNGFSRRFKRDLNGGTRTQHSPEQGVRRKWQQLALRQQLDHDEQPPEQEQEQDQEQEQGKVLRRTRRRITHECCREGCSYEDILAYCA